MLYETLSQPAVFLSLSLAGFLCGFIFDIKDILFFYLNKNKIIYHFLMFFSVFLMFFIAFYANLRTNHGEFRIFPCIAYGLSFYIQRFLMKNFVANPLIKCYNKLKGKFHGKRKKA